MPKPRLIRTNLYDLYELGAGYTAELLIDCIREVGVPENVSRGYIIISTDTGRVYSDVEGQGDVREVAEKIVEHIARRMSEDYQVDIEDIVGEINIPEGYEAAVFDISEYDLAYLVVVRRA